MSVARLLCASSCLRVSCALLLVSSTLLCALNFCAALRCQTKTIGTLTIFIKRTRRFARQGNRLRSRPHSRSRPPHRSRP